MLEELSLGRRASRPDFRRGFVLLYMYIFVRTIWYFISGPYARWRPWRRVPFPGPETALASTIGGGAEDESSAEKLRPLEAVKALLRLFNHLHEDSTTW